MTYVLIDKKLTYKIGSKCKQLNFVLMKLLFELTKLAS